MKQKKMLFGLLVLLGTLPLQAQKTLVQTSFESPEYNEGILNNQNKWSTTTGNAVVSSAAGCVNSGSQGLVLSSNATTATTELVGYLGNETGLQGVCYFDGYFKVQSLSAGNLAIALYDITPNSSAKRSLMIELLTPSSGKGNVKIYNGSSGTSEGSYTIGEWIRLSAQIDLESGNSKVAINGTVVNKSFAFRETWTPSSLGRPSGLKEVHTLRLSTSASATAEVATDDLYVSEKAIADISFGEASTDRTITLTQPTIGTIALTPNKTKYQVNDVVTALCTFPEGYRLSSWNGDLSSKTENPTSFTVVSNMSIGATVEVDPQNPPARYKVSIAQPEHATISVTPQSPDGYYYAHTSLAFTITPSPCYLFSGWSGSLSGNTVTQTLKLTEDISVGATVVPNSITPTIRRVSTAAEWKSALSEMNPGDEIVVANGTYDLNATVTITRSGCEERPILIRAETIGGVKLINKSAFNPRDVEYITFQGFDFQSKDVTVFKVESCRFCRITQNTFHLNESTSVKWILIGSYYSDTQLKSWNNRIDHNLFENKSFGGNFITIDGCSSIGQQSQYDRIDHNHFRNNTPRADNEKESIRVGVSGLSFSDGYTTIEYNLFEDCDGDPEIVSIKSCSNTIRYNTFRRCLGTLSFRQGFRNRAEGNYFFGEGKTVNNNGSTIGCGGMRVYSKDHVVINNYMEGLTGEKWDPAIALTNGDVDNTSTTQSAHFLPENVWIVNNTIVNCKSNIEIGFDNNGNYGKAPKNCRIENNIVVSSESPIVKSYSVKSLAGVSFAGNIFYPTGSAVMGLPSYTDAEVRNIDPLLIHTRSLTEAPNAPLHSQLLYKLSAASPAIDSSVGTVVNADFEGQTRTNTPDVGADEYASTGATMGPLTALHVGPDGTDYTLSNATGLKHQENGSTQFTLAYESSTEQLHLYATGSSEEGRIELINASGERVLSVRRNDTSKQTISLKGLNRGLYFVRCTNEKENQPIKWSAKFIKE